MPLNRYLLLVAVVLLATVPAVVGLIRGDEFVLTLPNLRLRLSVLTYPAWVALLPQGFGAYFLLRLEGTGTIIYTILGAFAAVPCVVVPFMPQVQLATFQYWLAAGLFGVAAFAKWQSYYID